jgi:3-oxoacyl-[acyl-carrier-protein] synthase III
MANGLAIAGIGVFLPPSRCVRELIADVGGDTTGFWGWERISQASDADHPSTMAAAALHRALANAGIDKDRVRLVLSTGMSRDYAGGWSLSTGVMRLLGLPSTCLGIDLTVGCLSTLCALDIAASWLGDDDVCAIVAAERWSSILDRSDSRLQMFQDLGDGAGALLVSRNAPNRLASYRGAVFVSNAEFNEELALQYGGTRCSTPPSGERASMPMGPPSAHEAWRHYTRHYSQIIAAARSRFGVTFDRLVCNQVSPMLVTKLGRLAGVPDDRISRTGPEVGHVGPVDLVLGLERFRERGQLSGNVLLVASTPFAFGGGLLQAE